MNLKYIYTRLHVQNYLDCKLFYQKILGLKVSLANDAQEYVEFDAGETKITILNRFSFREATPTRLKDYIDSIETATYDRRDAKILLSFAVPDLDEAILVPRGFANAQLKAKGVPIVSNPWQYPEEGLSGGLISACFRDPDGNLIELEQFLS